MMPDNVRRDIVTLLPASVVNELSCFVFYDNHPQDETKLDITIGTSRGEIMEFYQRNVVQSLLMPHPFIPNIQIHRNSVGEMFYFVEVLDSLYIISRKDQLRIHKRIDCIQSYEFNDFGCKGHVCLKVILKDDAVPLIFDDNFESMADQANIISSLSEQDSIPLVINLQRKLTQAKFTLMSNEKVYEEVLRLRQKSALSNYYNINPNVTDAIFGNKVGSSLKLKLPYPVVNVCNKKIVIILEVFTIDKPVEDVHVLLHRTHKSSLKYVTKLFNKTTISPFWVEKANNNIKPVTEMALTVVVDLEDLKHELTNRIEFDGVICYQDDGKEFSVPFDKVDLSSAETMKDDFDILLSNEQELIILALLATTEKIDLRLRPIRFETDPNINVSDIFCKYLGMEKLGDIEHVVVHKKSPYHLLYGVMVVLLNTDTSGNLTVSLHTRTSSQVLALIHYINDMAPYRIVITTTNQRITSKSDHLNQYEEIIHSTQNIDYTVYAKGILKQSAFTLEYLDNCMRKMNESKNYEIHSKVGTEIDLFANGVEDFLEFKKDLEDCLRQHVNLESEGMGLEINN